MSDKRTKKDYLILFVKGILMGTANKVPGVSGGMVSLVTGFYQEFIYSLQKINLKALNLLLKGRFKSFYRYINGDFMLAINGGSIFSYFSISLLLDYFLKTYTLYVWSLFFGLIIGSVIYVSKKIEHWNRESYLYLTIGLAIGLAISFFPPQAENPAIWFVFFCGLISVCGMTLPGLSGSFIIIILGNYSLLMVDCVNNLFYLITQSLQGNIGVWQEDGRFTMVLIILVFTLGSVVGMVSLSKVLGYLLKNYYNKVIALLVGFIAGSLGTVWPWKKEFHLYDQQGNIMLTNSGKPILKGYDRYIPDNIDNTIIMAMTYMILGIAVVLIIDYFDRKQHA